MFFSAYGLCLESDLPIPGLLSVPAPRCADVRISLGVPPAWRNDLPSHAEEIIYSSPSLDDRGQPTLTVWALAAGEFCRFRYEDGVEFLVDAAGTRIWGTWPDTLTLEDAATYLLGPVLGFVLRLRGITCLHASAVMVGAAAIALVGPPGAGKSTTAAAFARSGYRVMSDDAVPLEIRGDRVLVRPGHSRLCLWPESVHALYGSADALPRLVWNWEKCYLSLEETRPDFHREPVPLGAIYLLGERSADPAAPRVEGVPAGEGLMALVKNTYVNYLLDKGRRAGEFEFLGRMLESVPLRQVIPHQDLSRLSKLCEVIVEDFESLPSAAPAVKEAHSAGHV